jgi:7,8-dihydropterin-6-yl-methyl-4-(beta-D-ribofuranosyl)aminobenzene 5'-phosphate synthase
MTASFVRRLVSVLCLAVAGVVAAAEPPLAPARVTVLYDAFGPPSDLRKDWGFAALIEYGGRRILFDTGNDAAIFAHNARTLNVDLGRLDAVVISHRHGDHTSGLSALLAANPGAKIYVPVEGAYFKFPLPTAFLQPAVPSLPTRLRYFEGKPPDKLATGTPWEKADFQRVAQTTEIFPGFFLLTTKSEKAGTVDMNELSLAIRTPKGLVVVVGCSHPGVEKILGEAAKIDPKLYLVTGGFHLVLTPEAEIRRVADVLHDGLKVERVAPGHCTSEVGFAVFLEKYGDHFDAAGLGSVTALP